MRRFLGLLALLIVSSTFLGCSGSDSGPNKGPASGEVPKEQKETDDLMHKAPKK